MGGDGGTLNNSRHDHVRMRRELGGAVGAMKAAALSAKERSSVSVCAASRQPLRMPIVVDRLGQLYRKDALIACMLERAPAFAHITSLSRDTAPLKGAPAVCAVTREPVTTHGQFLVGWKCGCVLSSRAVAEVWKGRKGRDIGTEQTCVACSEFTRFVRLGMTGEEREKARETLMSEQAELVRKRRAAKAKRRAQGTGAEAEKRRADRVEAPSVFVPGKPPGAGTSPERDGRPSKAARLETSKSVVYNSLFVSSGENTDAERNRETTQTMPISK